jgi:hypothetical protein
MKRSLAITFVVLCGLSAPAFAGGITGKYVEGRSTDVWTGPCFANAEMNLGGKQAVLGWKVEHGQLDGVTLDGLAVVAVVISSDTLGLEQSGPAKAMIIVDEKASEAQRTALVKLVKGQAGKLVENIVAVKSDVIDLEVADCEGGGCARLKAGKASLCTRCLDHKDSICGNESAFYPPLTTGVKANPALATDFGYGGKELNETWKESGRRGAYVGSFAIR